MANDRRTEYVIYIKLDDAAEDGAATTPDSATLPNGEPVSQKAKSKKWTNTLVAAYGYAKRMIAPIVVNAVNTVEIRTGHSEMQRRNQMVMEGVSAAFDIGESVIGGLFLTGGNPIGAVVGGAVGIATKAISYEINKYNYELERTVNNIDLAEARRRAGTGWDRIGRNR